MFERPIIALQLEDPREETPAATRERLKSRFAPGSARRMTLLGMMVGTSLQPLAPDRADTLVYSSAFGESLSLENYLASFPLPSPTLFQSSIHPSGVQQGLIGQQRALGTVLPLAGCPELVLHSVLAAMTSRTERVLWCGGDERGTWLRERGAAAERSFAFALALGGPGQPPPLGRLTLSPASGSGFLSLADWFDLLQTRRPWHGFVGSGWTLSLDWS